MLCVSCGTIEGRKAVREEVVALILYHAGKEVLIPLLAMKYLILERAYILKIRVIWNALTRKGVCYSFSNL